MRTLECHSIRLVIPQTPENKTPEVHSEGYLIDYAHVQGQAGIVAVSPKSKPPNSNYFPFYVWGRGNPCSPEEEILLCRTPGLAITDTILSF